tara:strand:+ start:19112 stop:19642 length:531 start_codon:yes stop_codon:yes gene_type:complete
MPALGDVKTLHGRQYVYVNPDQAVGPAVWVLSSRDLSAAAAGDDATIAAGSATLDASSSAVLRGQLVAFTATGTLTAAVASSITTGQPVGVALNGTNPGQVCTFTNNINLDLSNAAVITDAGAALTPGDVYYLSATNPGNWTATPDTTTAGAVIIQCGVALAANSMHIEIQTATVV